MRIGKAPTLYCNDCGYRVRSFGTQCAKCYAEAIRLERANGVPQPGEAPALSRQEGGDPINPDHYRSPGGVDSIDAMKSMAEGWEAAGCTPWEAFCRLSAFKYIWRAGRKGDAVQDIQKSIWYLRMSVDDDPRKDKYE